MILYNITAVVHDDVDTEFREWTNRVFLFELAGKEIFKSQALLTILNSPNEGQSYSLQMHADNEEQIALFRATELPAFQEKIQDLWADKVFIFESQMQYIAVY